MRHRTCQLSGSQEQGTPAEAIHSDSINNQNCNGEGGFICLYQRIRDLNSIELYSHNLRNTIASNLLVHGKRTRQTASVRRRRKSQPTGSRPSVTLRGKQLAFVTLSGKPTIHPHLRNCLLRNETTFLAITCPASGATFLRAIPSIGF